MKTLLIIAAMLLSIPAFTGCVTARATQTNAAHSMTPEDYAIQELQTAHIRHMYPQWGAMIRPTGRKRHEWTEYSVKLREGSNRLFYVWVNPAGRSYTYPHARIDGPAGEPPEEVTK